MKAIFGNNLKQAREARGWKQPRAANEIGVTRQAYAAWEEGRGFPTECALVKVAEVFHITDVAGFISNEHFDIKKQVHQFPELPKDMALLQEQYKSAPIHIKLSVNILLGLVDLEG